MTTIMKRRGALALAAGLMLALAGCAEQWTVSYEPADPNLARSTRVSAVRVAISQYLVHSDDSADFLTQLRHVARVEHQAPPPARPAIPGEQFARP